MNYWAILEIDPTDDTSKIKKAYAKKLRVYHPERDAEGYQKLRESYAYALDYAKRNAGTGDAYGETYDEVSSGREETAQLRTQEQENTVQLQTPDQNHTTVRRRRTGQNSTALEQQAPDQDKEAVWQQEIESEAPGGQDDGQEFTWDDIREQAEVEVAPDRNKEFLDRLEELYNDFFRRIDINNWYELMNSDLTWDFYNRLYFRRMVVDFLSAHYFLPQNIWKFLDGIIHFEEIEEELYEEYPHTFSNHLSKVLSSHFYLSYEFFNRAGAEDVDYETYLQLREEAYDRLQKSQASERGNLNNARKCIEAAKAIFEGDPDLIRMEGQIYSLEGYTEKAMGMVEAALSIKPGDVEALYLKASLTYREKRMEWAIAICKKILQMTNRHYRTFILLIRIYEVQRKKIDATLVLCELINAFPGDEEAQKQLLVKFQEIKTKLRFMKLFSAEKREAADKITSTVKRVFPNLKFSFKIALINLFKLLVKIGLLLAAVTLISILSGTKYIAGTIFLLIFVGAFLRNKRKA